MNVRARFLESMINFSTRVSVPKWELGYWGKTADNWYEEGLPKFHYPKIPKATNNPTTSLYNIAFNSIKSDKLPAGIALNGGGQYWPTCSFPLFDDVKNELNMDKTQILVNVNLLFCPSFETQIIQEDDNQLIYIDLDGIKRVFMKDTGVVPSGLEWVVKDRKSWEKLKEERLNVKDIRNRFPAHWNKLVENYKNRDYVLVLGGYPYGLFGTLAHIMGYETLFVDYYYDPKLIHDIINTFSELWLAVYSEILSETDVDMYLFWEDLSAGTGPMISPKIIKEFMLPAYKRITSFLKARDVNVIFVDTDGNCFDIIPLFIEGGITGMYPIETSCGMDIVNIRKAYPELQIMGGISKLEIKYGKMKIDEILEPVNEVLKTGGYIPFCDHYVPPDVHWREFKYYRQKLNMMIENLGR